MARKTASRLELRRQAEAVEGQEEAAAPKATRAKRAAAPKAKRTKEKPAVRKKLVWVLYNGSMKEEGRFAYEDRQAAEEKLELLRSKSKKLYFIHPIKEVIGDPSATVGLAAAAAAAKLAATMIPDVPDEEEPEEIADIDAELGSEPDESMDDDSDGDDDDSDSGDGDE